MKYSIKSKGFELHSAQNYVIEQGLNRLNRLCKNFPEDLVNANVVVSFHNPPKTFETHLQLEVPGQNLSSVTNNYKFTLSINEAVDKVRRQLKTHKAKLKNENTYSQVSQARGKLA